MNRLKQHIFFFLFSAFTISATAQDFPYQTKQYDFIRYDTNQLRFYGDSLDYNTLYNSFNNVIFDGKGQINVVHIGGSHIQADIWSGRMRSRLQNIVPGLEAGRGFIFPFKIARTNNPYNYYLKWSGDWERCRNVERKECTLGLAGMSVSTSDSISSILVTTRGKYHPQYEFKRIKVFHEIDSNYCIEIEDTAILRQISTNYEKGYTEFDLKQYADTLRLRFVKQDTLETSFTLYGILLETEDPGFYYHAIGVNGASTSSYLKCQLFENQMSVIKPDLVVFSIGINDAYERDFNSRRYEQNYDSLIARVKRANPNAAILLTTNNDSYYKRRYVNKNALKVNEVMQRLSEKHGCAVWDMLSVMGGLNSVVTWQNHGLMKRDKIHFTSEGYMLIGDLMFNAIFRSYENHIRKKGFNN